MKFRTRLLQAGKTATGIRVPPELVERLAAGKRPPVRVTINGYTYRSTVAVMSGKFMVGVSAEVREKAGVAGGDEVNVDIELDTAPREVTVPPDFRRALDRDPKAKRSFEGLSFSKKKALVLPVERAKTAETRERNIAKAIKSLSTLVLTLSVLLARNAQAQGDPQETARAAALVAQYDSGWNSRDTVSVSRLLAPRYQYFTSRGGVRSRTEIIEFLADPAYLLKQAKRSELVVTLSGPVAVVSSRWQGHGTYRGKRFVDDQRCGQVWLQTARGWQLLSEHCVQIVPDTPAPSN